MPQKEIVLLRTTHAGPQDPRANEAWAAVFEDDDDEVIVQCYDVEKIEDFLLKLQASLRGSCEETRVILPTIDNKDNQAVLDGAVVPFYKFYIIDEIAEFLIETDAGKQITVTLFRKIGNRSFVKPKKQRTHLQL
jgi:hypothetical protein